MIEVLFLIMLFAVAWWLYSRRPSKLHSTDVVPERFVVFDLETTGLRSDRHEIIEIGAIKVYRDGDKLDTFQALVKPSSKVPPRITKLTGITQQMLDAEGASLVDALSDFRTFVGDLPLVAFNAQFDHGFLKSACETVSVGHFSNEVYCALELARRAYPGLPSYKLSELSKMGNMRLEDEHRALADCQRAMIVYAASARKLGVHR